MEKKSYHHFCPLAYSLDRIGDRWTLLLIREMLYGPRRFSDLERGLHGIPTNLLASRLKELEEAGFIAHQVLPPPASSKVYALTDYGRSTKPIVHAFTVWGFHLLYKGSLREDFYGVVQTLYALETLFDSANAADFGMVGEFRLAGEVFTVTVQQAQIHIQQGPPQQPDLVIATDTKTLLRLILTILNLPQALEGNLVQIPFGDKALFARFITLFNLPPQTVSGA